MVHENCVRDEKGISVRVSNDFEKIVYVENAKNVNIKQSVEMSVKYTATLEWTILSQMARMSGHARIMMEVKA